MDNCGAKTIVTAKCDQNLRHNGDHKESDTGHTWRRNEVLFSPQDVEILLDINGEIAGYVIKLQQ